MPTYTSTQYSALSSSASASADDSATSTGIDVESMQVLLDMGSPSYKASQVLSPDRFQLIFPSVTCSVCRHVADNALTTPCCSKLVCVLCVWEHLSTTRTWPSCMCDMYASGMRKLSSYELECLSHLPVRCDDYMSSLSGCQHSMKLFSLQTHVKVCPFNTYSGPVCVTRSSTVADVLTASPSKLRGEAAEHLTTHLVQSKSTTDGKLELRTGGTPALYVRTTQGGSDAVSVRQMQRRSAEIRQAKDLVCGGTAGVGKQDAYELRSMSQIDREKFLKSAGVSPCAPSSHSGLALKADLHMPWNQLRKLRRWLKSFGCEIESENTMRQQLAEEVPAFYASEMCPFTLPSSDVVSSPMVVACNLTEIVLVFLDQYEEAGMLTDHGIIPQDDIWVKLGGDHGGRSFKLSFQICNRVTQML